MKTKKITLLLLIIICSFNTSHAQVSKFLKKQSVFASSSISFYPTIESYNYNSSFKTIARDIDLFFLTPTSGVFEVDSIIEYDVKRQNIHEFPTQLFNFGASIQLRNLASLYQEVSIPRFSVTKSSLKDIYSYTDTSGTEIIRNFGYDQTSTIFSLRYEVGKYFGNKKSKIRFGLAASMESSIFSYKKTPITSQNFPIRGNIVALELALIPSLSIKLSKKVNLDFKLIPNVLVADYVGLKLGNPVLLPRQQTVFKREYNLPEINFISHIQIRYQIKEAKRKRRSSAD